MKTLPTIRLTAYLLGLAGAALLTVLLIQQGAQDVIRAVAAAGWWLAVIAVFHLLPLFLDTFEWAILFPPGDRIRLRTIYWVRWLGESFSNLVPAAQVGGDILRARLVVLHGSSIPLATATVLVDITVSVFTQTFFTLLGISLLILATGKGNLLAPVLVGAPLAFGAIAGLYCLQRLGLMRLFGVIICRCAKDPKWRSLAVKGGEIDQTLRKIYARRGAVATCSLTTILSFVIGSVEVWIGLSALGIPAGFDKALILESVGQGIQTALCLVPSALGVREGGYLVVGGLLGIPGQAALALALIRRVREMTLGVPGLICWQLIEARRFWQSRSADRMEHSENEGAAFQVDSLPD